MNKAMHTANHIERSVMNSCENITDRYRYIAGSELEALFGKDIEEIEILYNRGNISCIYHILGRWYISRCISSASELIHYNGDCRGETYDTFRLEDGRTVKNRVWVFDTGARVVRESVISD